MAHLLQPHPDAGRVRHDEVATLAPTPSAPADHYTVGALTVASPSTPVPALKSKFEGLTTAKLTTATYRLNLLRAYWELRARRVPAREAAHELGVNHVQLHRLVKRLTECGLNRDSSPEALRLALVKRTSPGAPGAWDHLLNREDFVRELRAAYIATIGGSHEASGRDRRTGLISRAIEHVAETPVCPERLAERLRTGYQPESFKRLLKEITPEIEALIKGQKHFLHNGLTSRRAKLICGPDGQLYQQPGGYIWQFDDMSHNTPFWVELPDGSIILSRQSLNANDDRHNVWLGFELIARPREAYRAADVLRFLRKLCADHGKPDVIRLEKGIWMSRIIYGIKITPDGEAKEEQWCIPAADAGEDKLLQDGLAAIGIKIQYVTGSHGKGGLESKFRPLQDYVALRTQEFCNLRRYAGANEHASKQLRRVRSESHHPADVGFAPMHVLAERITAAMQFDNRRAVSGPSKESLLAADLAQRPLPPLTRDDLAFLLPDHRLLTVRGGMVTATVAGQPVDFRAPELFARAGDGTRFHIRFDSCDHAQGASVFNERGQFLGWAAYEPPGPQYRAKDESEVAGLTPIDMAPWGHNPNSGYLARKQQTDYLVGVYRGLPRPGSPPTKTTTILDGTGRIGTASNRPAAPTTVEVHPAKPSHFSARQTLADSADDALAALCD